MRYARISSLELSLFLHQLCTGFERELKNLDKEQERAQLVEKDFFEIRADLRERREEEPFPYDYYLFMPNQLVDGLKEMGWDYAPNLETFVFNEQSSAPDLDTYFKILDELKDVLNPLRQDVYSNDNARLKREEKIEKYLKPAKKIMRLTYEGRAALQRLEQDDILPRFTETESSNVLGFFRLSSETVEVIITDRQNDPLTISTTLVHEMEHKEQAARFPELFSDELSFVDRFVAMKLKEWMAFYKSDSHARQAAAFLKTKDEVTKADFIKDSQIHQHLVPPPASALDLLFDRSHVNWPHYEEEFFREIPELEASFTADRLERAVASSQLMKLAFLERFCLDTEGNSLMLPDKESFRERLIRGICTRHLYQPQLPAQPPASQKSLGITILLD